MLDGSLTLLRGPCTLPLPAAFATSTRISDRTARATETKASRRSATRSKTVLETIDPAVYLVIENSAGAGNLAGGTLEELGGFMRTLDHPQLGVCLDTAHAWAAGYEINSTAGVDRVHRASGRA